VCRVFFSSLSYRFRGMWVVVLPLFFRQLRRREETPGFFSLRAFESQYFHLLRKGISLSKGEEPEAFFPSAEAGGG